MDEELARFAATGPTPAELQRAKAGYLSDFMRRLERVGGFGGKADVLAMNQTYRDDPDFYQTILADVRKATTRDLQNAAKTWLSDDVYILQVRPYPSYETASRSVDRTKLGETSHWMKTRTRHSVLWAACIQCAPGSE